jgi:hypothetical protein
VSASADALRALLVEAAREGAAQAIALLRAAERDDDDLVTAHVASKELGLTLKALEARRARNQPPLAVKRGGRVLYQRRELRRFRDGDTC